MAKQLFDEDYFLRLEHKANESPRRRSNANIHASETEDIQRLFITINPDSYVRPHRHCQAGKWECFLIIKGAMSFLIFDDSGTCIERYELDASGEKRGLEIPENTWHVAVPTDSAATFFEVKPGPYEVLSDKDFAPWAPEEFHPDCQRVLARLKALKVGQRLVQQEG